MSVEILILNFFTKINQRNPYCNIVAFVFLYLGFKNYFSMLKTSSLYFSYEEEVKFDFPNIELEYNQDLLILGDSGVGKTTLLHLIAGLLRPVSGSILVLGEALHKMGAKELDQFRGNHIGMVFQRPHFVRSLTLQENLELVQYFGTRHKDTKRIASVLDKLGIKHKAKKRPHQLSQGEQQRAAIALATVNSPKLILADEPTASLDDTNCIKVLEMLKEQANSTAAQLVVITHDQRLKSHFQHTLTL